MLLLSTHSSLLNGRSLFLLLYGGSPPASLASHLAGLLRRMGSLHKSMADSVVCICGQLKKCCVVCSWMRQWGQSSDGCVEASILCRYNRRKGDLFVHSWARVRRVCGVSSLQCCWLAVGMCAIFCYCLFSEMLRDNTCMYVAHVCFYVCCSDSAGVCGDVCGVSGVVKSCGFL